MMNIFYKIALLIMLPSLVVANNDKLKGKYTKEKKISESFTVNGNAFLEIENTYGDVTIATWDQNKTVIDITIKTNGDDESKVMERLENITVAINGSASSVTAKTLINDTKSRWGWGNNSSNISMEINYVVKMPITNTLNLTNKYGAITLNDLDGRATIHCKYGQVFIGKLNGDNNLIDLKYVDSATINAIKNGRLEAGYSEFTLGTSDNLTLKADYTRSRIDNIRSLNYDNRYGQLSVGNAASVVGEASYNSGSFSTISNSINISARYSGISVDQITKSAKDVTINGGYSKITLGFVPEYDFNYKVNVNYGSFKGYDFTTVTNKDTSGRNNSFEGYYKSQTSSNKVTVSSSYGSVVFNK